MVNYKCYRCGYESHIKTIMNRHLSRKNKCPPKIHNVEIDVCKEYILQGLTFEEFCEIKKESIKSQHFVNSGSTFSQHLVNNESTFSQHLVNNKPQNSQHLVNNDSKTKSSKGIFECKYCNKILSYKQSLYIHYKSCKEKKNQKENENDMRELVNLLNKELDKKDKELELQNKQIDNLIKKVGITHNNVNIQNNFKLLNYKDTDISHISDVDIRNCLQHYNFCIPQLVKKVHFDSEKPENHNIYISNIKNNYVMIYDKDRWILKDRDEAINTLIDDKEIIFEQKLEEWVENGKNYPDIMDKFNRYIAKKENNTILNAIKEEIKLMLFNNRDKIQDSKMLT